MAYVELVDRPAVEEVEDVAEEIEEANEEA
jgi:hypothetical protein